jgi:hypothetical protein
MPVYCFSTPAGEIFEEFFPFGEAPRSFVVANDSKGNEIIAERDFGAEHNPRRAGSGWPLACEASAVNPLQAQELRDLYKREGVPTEVDRGGRPIYRDANHRKRALKCRGYIDRDSY